MEFKLTQETLQELLNYLASKPYGEVAQLINKITNEINNVDKQVESEIQ